jgi:hypothetical protein
MSLREGGKKAINMNKVSEILQKSDESPAQFCERLCEGYHPYSPSILKPLKLRE